MTNINELRNKLILQKNKIGLVNGTVEIEEYDKIDEPISAYISPEAWNIKITLKKEFNPIQDNKQIEYAKKKNIKNGLETMVMHIGGLHEPAHWELPVDSGRGCPYNLYHHDKILESIKLELPDNKKKNSSYVANAFEDMIINSRCKEWNGDFSGQILFWDLQGVLSKNKGQKSYSPFYEAFVKLNLHLFGDKDDESLLKRNFSNKSDIDEAVKNVIKDLKLDKKISNTSHLFIKENWPLMSKIFSKHLKNLLNSSPPQEKLSAFSGDKDSGNGIEEKMKTGEGREKIVFDRYSSGDERSSNFEDFPQLDSLYKQLARSIPVKVEAITKSNRLKIAPLNYRAFDPETDDASKIKLSKLFSTDKGLSFAYSNQPLTIDYNQKVQIKSFPDFKMLILDNSFSMKDSVDGKEGSTKFIPWGDNSKYHYALLGFYGIENFLQKQGIAQYINHGVSLFSNETKYKEGSFFELEKIRKFALSPEWGATRLDAKVLTESLSGRKAFVLSISDGEINNWSSEKSNFQKLVMNNYFAHIQIGSSSTFAKDLESWQIPVFYVNSGEDLSKLMVNVTANNYKSFVKNL